MNKIKLVTTIAILFISVFLTSCSTIPRFYTPNRNPIPLFKNKGDLYLDLSSNLTNKADATIGYAIFNGLGGYAGFGVSSERSQIILRPETPFKCRGFIQNYGLGYYLSEKQSKKFRFEIYGDICLGKYEIIKYSSYSNQYGPSPTAYLNGQYQKIGILTNLGYINRNKVFQYGYTARFSNLKFFNPSYVEKPRLYNETERLTSQKDYYVLEHGLYGILGRKAVKVQLEMAFYHGLNSSDKNAVQNNNSSYILSLIINLNVFSKSKNNTSKLK